MKTIAHCFLNWLRSMVGSDYKRMMQAFNIMAMNIKPGVDAVANLNRNLFGELHMAVLKTENGAAVID